MARTSGDELMADTPKKNDVTLVSAEFYVRMKNSDGSVHMVRFKHKDLLNFLNNIEIDPIPAIASDCSHQFTISCLKCGIVKNFIEGDD